MSDHEKSHRPAIACDHLLQIVLLTSIRSGLPAGVTWNALTTSFEGRLDAPWLLGCVSSVGVPLLLLGVMTVPEQGA